MVHFTQRRQDTDELGTVVEKQLLSLATPSFVASAGEEKGVSR